MFSKHEVFLEISIPTIINNIERDKSQFQPFTDEVLWVNRETNKIERFDILDLRKELDDLLNHYSF